MKPADALPEHDVDTYVPMSNAVVEAIGTVLAAVVRILNAKVILRRGGPGLFRRPASIIAAFIAFMVALVRGNALLTDEP